DPLSGTTCSNTNTETFQLSVDEVCEGVDTAVKLLTVPIGQVFDGYASEDVTNTTTCGAERVSFQVCQRFVKEFEKLYDGRNKTQYPSPNPTNTRKTCMVLPSLPSQRYTMKLNIVRISKFNNAKINAT
ncbi:hypothetical protein THAOC_25253, partial [Thalassiosira oceanica]